MNNPFNPFDPVLENNKLNPHARSLRSSFWQKIKDTWRVLVGNWNLTAEEACDRTHDAGLFDYMGLGLVRLAAGIVAFPAVFLSKAAGVQNNPGILRALAFVLAVPLFLVVIALWFTDVLIRYPLGLVLTVALSPIVLMVHAVTKIIHYSIDWSIQHEISELKKSDPENKKDNYQSLYEALNNSNDHIFIRENYDEELKDTVQISNNRLNITVEKNQLCNDRFFKLIRTLNPHGVGEKIDELERGYSTSFGG